MKATCNTCGTPYDTVETESGVHDCPDNEQERVCKELSQARVEVARLREVIKSFVEQARAAVWAHRRPKGGQQVPYHGDFANLPPSSVGHLERWADFFSAALKGPSDAS